ISTERLLRELPGVRAAMTEIETARRRDLPKGFSLNLQHTLAALPRDAGQIRDAYTPPAPKNPPIVLLQDIHMNPEAQQNLAKLLSSLNETAAEQHQSLLIGVEGAFRPFDFSCFRAFLNKATVRKIADHFLETNR